MEKIQELVEKGNLSKSLMEDKEFVNKAKEIFKSQKIDIDDKKLAQIMDEIETQLKTGSVLDDKELEQVSGGVSGTTIARGVIKTATTVVGAVVGGKYVGPAVGLGTGMTVGGVTGAIVGGIAGGPQGAVYTGVADAVIGARGGKAVGMAAGIPAGGYLGYKLGNLICDSIGLKEQSEK